MGSYLPTYYWFFSSKKQIEASKEIETNFINTCNNFLKKIKINKDNIKIELLEKHYKLYEDSNLKIQVIGKIEYGKNDIGYPDFLSILFEDGKVKDIENLIEGIKSAHEQFEKNGVNLKSEYNLFIEEVEGFIVNGKLIMKYEWDKITYGFILDLKTDDKKYELTGSLKLEIIFKKKTYIIRFNNNDEKILFCTIINILIFAHEDKIPLIMGLLEKLSKEDKNAKNIDFNDLFKNLPQFNEN